MEFNFGVNPMEIILEQKERAKEEFIFGCIKETITERGIDVTLFINKEAVADAMKKAVPMLVKNKRFGLYDDGKVAMYTGNCPECQEWTSNTAEGNPAKITYCSKCGQKLDWR